MRKTNKEIHNNWCDLMVKKAQQNQNGKQINGLYKKRLAKGE